MDIAHQTHEAESVVESACAPTNVQKYSEETEVTLNTFEEATTLSDKAHWETA